MRAVLAIALLALSGVAESAVICTGCEAQDAEGTYLGAFDPAAGDTATFQHTGTGPLPFSDFWVFDVLAPAEGSVSADFTLLAGLQNFHGQLFLDNKSECGPSAGDACSEVTHKGLVAQAFEVDGRWEILFPPLEAGRYVLRISGNTAPPRPGAYTGQMGFGPVVVGEPDSIALLGAGLFTLGLLGLGVAGRR